MDTVETTRVHWVHRTELPELAWSTDRVTCAQVEQLLAYSRQPDLSALCD